MPEERKLVTVLFADVTGSTELGENLDPEDVRALMSRYYEHARQVVADHGGTLEKFIGDAVMAVFGLPQVHGNDAERAVAAALALRKVVKVDPILAEVVLRVGVNTGEVVATSDSSSGDFLVTGDAVNVAARLQQCANPGEILTSERTHGATMRAFLFSERRTVELKGKWEPQSVVPVVGMRTTRLVERPPLVGRKRELAHLSMLRSWALEEHRPQLVSLVAPAGTGKTRLLEEFLAQGDADNGFQVATGRCLPYGQTLTHWPLRGLLEDLVGQIERDRVVNALLRGGLGEEDASRLSDLVLTPLGINSGELAERESIFNAWRLLIETVAKEAPRIVVFEDLHWASDSLLDLVEHIMHPRTQAPLLIIAISRPELLDRRPAWGGGGRENFTALVLKPLNESQTAELVEHLGGHFTEAILHRIIERSGGNPFFATELVRGVRGHGSDPSPDADVVVPDTVQAAILAQLDALSPVERRVLQAAAVVGRTVRPAMLAAIMPDLGLAEISGAIEALLSRDIAVPTDGGAFTFRHALIRDVAYGTLSRAERIRMHGAAASSLEEYDKDRVDQYVELIAYHYREAVMLSRRSTVSLVLPFEPAKAIAFLERAGEVATRAGALAEARAHLESAIAIAPIEEHLRLYEKLGDCVLWGDTALNAYRLALERWRDEGRLDPLIGARLLRKFVTLYSRSWGDFATRPHPDTITEMGAEAERLAALGGNEDEALHSHLAVLWWRCIRHYITGEEDLMAREEAVEGYRVTLDAAAQYEQRHDWNAFSETLDLHSVFAARLGKMEEVIAATQRRLAVPALPWEERCDALGVMAWTYHDLGKYEQVIECARDEIAHLRLGDPIAYLGHASALAAEAAFLSGQWGEVEKYSSFVEDARKQRGADAPLNHPSVSYWAALQLGLAYEERTAIDTAAAALRRVLELESSSIDQRKVNQLQLAAWMNDDPLLIDLDLVARVAVNKASALGIPLMFLNERGILAPEAFVRRTAERARVEDGGVDRVIQFAEIARALAAGDTVGLARAIDEAEQHNLIPHAARMRIVLAQMTGDPAPLEQARPVLERLGDRQFLRRLEEVAASLRQE